MGQNQNAVFAHPGLSWVKGATAGLVGTGPMTVFMLLTQRFLPKGQRYTLPPEMITQQLAKRAHVRQHMNKRVILGATMVSHFAYGATMGMIYSPLEKLVPLPAVLKGVIFGLFIWAASYLGLLPLLGISAAGEKEPMKRNLMMVAAHILWGATLGVVAKVLISE